MSDKKISQLTAASTPLTGTEELAIVQSGSTVKATAQDVADLAGAPYASYVAQIDFTGGSTLPTFYVFQNTIGNIVWSWCCGDPVETLIGTLAGAFPAAKLWISAHSDVDGNLYNLAFLPQGDDDNVAFRCFDETGNYVTPNSSSGAFIEIRVYP
jgi:hypothetical protein